MYVLMRAIFWLNSSRFIFRTQYTTLCYLNMMKRKTNMHMKLFIAFIVMTYAGLCASQGPSNAGRIIFSNPEQNNLQITAPLLNNLFNDWCNKYPQCIWPWRLSVFAKLAHEDPLSNRKSAHCSLTKICTD